jgi:drug/metabolite transporter superfamily protein YnfA
MEEKRKLALFGLSVSLAVAFSLHYFSPVLIAPFAFAELVRTYKQRRPDFPVWLALAVPFFVLIPLIPVILATRVNTGVPFAWYARPSLYGSLESFASQFLSPSLVALIGLNCIYLVYKILWPGRTADFAAISKLKELRPDAALILGLTSLPVFAVLLAKFVTHVFFNRYAATGMIGIVALIAAGIWLAFSGRKGPALAAMLVFAGVFAHTAYYDLKSAQIQRMNLLRGVTIKRIPSAARNDHLPIVAAGPNEFMDLTYYGDRALRDRLYYVSSEQSAVRIMGFSFLERMMIGPAPFFGTQVKNYDDFLQAHPKFYLFGGPNWWLYPKLFADHARIQILQAGLTDQFGDYADFLCLVDTQPSRN